MLILLNLLFSALAVAITTYLIPGVTIDGYMTAIVVVIILAIVNSTVGPFLKILTLPLNILTLGVISLIINILMVLFVAEVVPGFTISGFWIALVFAGVLALVNTVL